MVMTLPTAVMVLMLAPIVPRSLATVAMATFTFWRADCADVASVRVVPARLSEPELVDTASEAALLYDAEMFPSEVKMATDLLLVRLTLAVSLRAPIPEAVRLAPFRVRVFPDTVAIFPLVPLVAPLIAVARAEREP